MVLIECKTPVRPSVSWFDGALQVHDDYETNVPELFVANIFSVASEGKDLRYGSIRMPVNLWGPWRTDDAPTTGTMADVAKAARGLFEPRVLLDILANFTLFATDSKKRGLNFILPIAAALAAIEEEQKMRSMLRRNRGRITAIVPIRK